MKTNQLPNHLKDAIIQMQKDPDLMAQVNAVSIKKCPARRIRQIMRLQEQSVDELAYWIGKSLKVYDSIKPKDLKKKDRYEFQISCMLENIARSSLLLKRIFELPQYAHLKTKQ